MPALRNRPRWGAALPRLILSSDFVPPQAVGHPALSSSHGRQAAMAPRPFPVVCCQLSVLDYEFSSLLRHPFQGPERAHLKSALPSLTFPPRWE